MKAFNWLRRLFSPKPRMGYYLVGDPGDAKRPLRSIRPGDPGMVLQGDKWVYPGRAFVRRWARRP